MTAFDVLLAETIRTPGLLAVDASPDEERKLFEREHVPPLTMLLDVATISQRAIDMIVTFEVSSEAVYDRLYVHPVWPKGNSGVTIGIGYDIGYANADGFAKDWTTGIGAGAVATLAPACGKTGAAANQILPQLQAISVPFAVASSVFGQTDIPRYTARTLAALPSAAANLTPDCLGALVSLVYNRGASFSLPGDRYVEMRAIHDDIQKQNLKDIPAQLRSMKRLWAGNPGLAGLVQRRELEAVLFEQGLA
jgi:GH24 family phage-related lysozyme (muramidase)